MAQRKMNGVVKAGTAVVATGALVAGAWAISQSAQAKTNQNESDAFAASVAQSVDGSMLLDLNKGLSNKATAAKKTYRATLQLANGTKAGTVTFSPTAGGTLVVAALSVPTSLIGTSSFHGIHIHDNGDPANGSGCIADPSQPSSTWFTSADGHYAGTAGATHGNHAGDLPPLLVRPNGKGEAAVVTDRFTPEAIAGKTIILHAKADNLGNVPTGSEGNQYSPNSPAATDLTARTGNAGDRIACGVVSN